MTIEYCYVVPILSISSHVKINLIESGERNVISKSIGAPPQGFLSVITMKMNNTIETALNHYLEKFST